MPANLQSSAIARRGTRWPSALSICALIGVLWNAGCDFKPEAKKTRPTVDRSAEGLSLPTPTVAPITVLPDTPALPERVARHLELRRAFFNGDFGPLDRAINGDHEQMSAGKSRGDEAEELVYHLANDTRLAGIDRCREWLQAMPQSYAAHWACGAIWEEGAWQARTHKFAREVSAAQFAIMRERLARSRELLVAALELSPKPVQALTLLARSHFVGGDREAAEDYLQRAEALVPWYPYLHEARLNYSLPQWGGSQDAIVAAFERAKAAGVEEGHLLYFQDVYVVRPSQTPTPGAERAYWQRVIGERPTWSRLRALGNYHWGLKEWREMVAAADRMISLKPGLRDGYYMRAVANEALGNHAAALLDYRMAAAMGHEHATEYLIRAHFHGYLGLPPRDLKKLEAFCRYGAGLGVPPAALCVASIYFEAERVGEPFRKDVPQALAWYLLAARGGHFNAQHDFGWLVFTQRAPGVTPELGKEIGVFWLRRAAEQDQEFAKQKLKQANISISEPINEPADEWTSLLAILWWLLRKVLGGELPAF